MNLGGMSPHGQCLAWVFSGLAKLQEQPIPETQEATERNPSHVALLLREQVMLLATLGPAFPHTTGAQRRGCVR